MSQPYEHCLCGCGCLDYWKVLVPVKSVKLTEICLKAVIFHAIPCVSVPWMFQPFKPFAHLVEMLSKLLVSVNQ